MIYEHSIEASYRGEVLTLVNSELSTSHSAQLTVALFPSIPSTSIASTGDAGIPLFPGIPHIWGIPYTPYPASPYTPYPGIGGIGGTPKIGVQNRAQNPIVTSWVQTAFATI